jgi:small-conductance mechanosensitive channel
MAATTAQTSDFAVVTVLPAAAGPKVSQDNKAGDAALYQRWSWALIGVVVGAIGLSIIPAIVKYFVFNALPALVIENVFVLPLIAILACILCICKFPAGMERSLNQAALALAVVDFILSIAGYVVLRFTYYFYSAAYIFLALSITATVCLAASIVLASVLVYRMRVAFVSGCVSA